MNDLFSPRRVRAASFALVALGLAASTTTAGAARADGAAPPAASASGLRSATPEPAHAQRDDSASLRQGTVGAINERATRVQVQGIWIELVAGKTQLLRNGQAAGLETLRPGEPIRFTVVAGSGAASAMKVIYAP